VLIPSLLAVGFKLPKRATVVVLTGEMEEIDMKFDEMNVPIPCIDMFLGDPSDIDAFHKYWMDVADPRGKYDAERQDFLMSGGGYY
jgi:hypothetical protein